MILFALLFCCTNNTSVRTRGGSNARRRGVRTRGGRGGGLEGAAVLPTNERGRQARQRGGRRGSRSRERSISQRPSASDLLVIAFFYVLHKLCFFSLVLVYVKYVNFFGMLCRASRLQPK